MYSLPRACTPPRNYFDNNAPTGRQENVVSHSTSWSPLSFFFSLLSFFLSNLRDRRENKKSYDGTIRTVSKLDDNRRLKSPGIMKRKAIWLLHMSSYIASRRTHRRGEREKYTREQPTFHPMTVVRENDENHSRFCSFRLFPGKTRDYLDVIWIYTALKYIDCLGDAVI